MGYFVSSSARNLPPVRSITAPSPGLSMRICSWCKPVTVIANNALDSNASKPSLFLSTTASPPWQNSAPCRQAPAGAHARTDRKSQTLTSFSEGGSEPSSQPALNESTRARKLWKGWNVRCGQGMKSTGDERVRGTLALPAREVPEWIRLFPCARFLEALL